MSRLCIIGVGLIGSSVARSARLQGLVQGITGYDRDAANLDLAVKLGVIDQASESLADAVAGADWVFLAVPVGSIEAVLSELEPHWNAATTYTDVSSTKQDVLAALSRVFGHIPANFVPGHPIAGAERSGVEAGKADLFAGKRVILTPVSETSDSAVDKVATFWQTLGAHVSFMDPLRHDQILAATSHLPHVLAFALTDMLGRMDEQEAIFQYAAGGFRDFSRIASSDPGLWRDICLANQAQIVPLIDAYCAALTAIRDLIAQESATELHDTFNRARSARERFLNLSQP